MIQVIFIFKSDGKNLGFIRDNYVFSRDGIYLGWVEKKEENNLVWDVEGKYRGVLREDKGNYYILTKKFEISPISRIPKKVPNISLPPDPPKNIPPIVLPVDAEDAFGEL